MRSISLAGILIAHSIGRTTEIRLALIQALKVFGFMFNSRAASPIVNSFERACISPPIDWFAFRLTIMLRILFLFSQYILVALAFCTVLSVIHEAI
jgi:hypothetical protein